MITSLTFSRHPILAATAVQVIVSDSLEWQLEMRAQVEVKIQTWMIAAAQAQ